MGFDKFHLVVLNRMKIAFSSSPEHEPHDTADTALGFIITLQQHILEHGIRVRRFVSAQQEFVFLAPTLHLPDTKVGLTGLGRVGSSVVKRLKPFPCLLISVDSVVFDQVIPGSVLNPISLPSLTPHEIVTIRSSVG